MLVGTGGSKRSKPAWEQVYRAVNHGKARDRCARAAALTFPQGIQDFANMFVSMQKKRHAADYTPDHKAFKSAVSADIDAVEVAIGDYNATEAKDRRAFAVWVLLEDRKS